MEKKNWYIENVGAMAALGLPWNVAVDVFNKLVPGGPTDPDEIARQRSEFYNYVKGRVFAEDGTEIK